MNFFWKKTPGIRSAVPWDDAGCHAVAVTDTGYLRSHNEDSIRFVHPSDETIRKKKGCLAIVADGMGGHASGEIASGIAVEVISEIYYASNKRPLKALKTAATVANSKIWERSQKDKKMNGMGTTCTAVAIVGGDLFVMHIGDSRAYLLKKDRIFQISEDHTYVQQLLNSGEISADEAQHHPDGNILTKSLGTAKKRSVDLFRAPYPFEKGDKLLLSSDGLHDYFTTEELCHVLQKPDLNKISVELSDHVFSGGAHDNFSILLIEIRQKKATAGTPTKAIEVEV